MENYDWRECVGNRDGQLYLMLTAAILGQNVAAMGGHILVDTGATNLLSQAQAFDNAVWSMNAGLPVVANAIAAPDGTTTADKFLPDTSNSAHGIYQGGGKGAGTFTFSVYAKDAGYPRIGIRVYDGAAYQIRGTFNISTGAIVSTEAGSLTITPLPNGWYFLTGTGTTAADMGAASGWVIESLPGSAVVQGSFIGDGTSGAYLWQGQAVSGSSPGPIIYR